MIQSKQSLSKGDVVQKRFSLDEEATGNLTGFFELLMEIDREQKLLLKTDD